MQDAFSNMEDLLGVEGVNKLGRAKIAVFGLGGVGSYVAETLARCGVGSLTLVDAGTVEKSGINRQLYALQSNIGKSRVQAVKERVLDIDKQILVNTYETFYNKDTAGMFDLSSYDYIIDTLGNIPSKLLLIERAKACRTQILSCMGTEGRLNPLMFEIGDISRTRVCPVAKVIRTELHKKGIRRVKVLFSRERPKSINDSSEKKDGETKTDYGSISFMPGIAGMLITREVVSDLLKEHGHLSRKLSLPSRKG